MNKAQFNTTLDLAAAWIEAEEDTRPSTKTFSPEQNFKVAKNIIVRQHQENLVMADEVSPHDYAYFMWPGKHLNLLEKCKDRGSIRLCALSIEENQDALHEVDKIAGEVSHWLPERVDRSTPSIAIEVAVGLGPNIVAVQTREDDPKKSGLQRKSHIIQELSQQFECHSPDDRTFIPLFDMAKELYLKRTADQISRVYDTSLAEVSQFREVIKKVSVEGASSLINENQRNAEPSPL